MLLLLQETREDAAAAVLEIAIVIATRLDLTDPVQ